MENRGCNGDEKFNQTEGMGQWKFLVGKLFNSHYKFFFYYLKKICQLIFLSLEKLIKMARIVDCLTNYVYN